MKQTKFKLWGTPADERFEILKRGGFPGLRPYLNRCVKIWEEMANTQESNCIIETKRKAYDTLGYRYDDSYCAICQYVGDTGLMSHECHLVCPLMRIWPDGCCESGPYEGLVGDPTPEAIKECSKSIIEEIERVKKEANID